MLSFSVGADDREYVPLKVYCQPPQSVLSSVTSVPAPEYQYPPSLLLRANVICWLLPSGLDWFTWSPQAIWPELSAAPACLICSENEIALFGPDSTYAVSSGFAPHPHR